MRSLLVPATCSVLLLAGCGSAADDPAAPVVATTTIWGSIAAQITDCAGAGEVRTLMPAGADAHDFSPSSADVAAMVGAPLVIANGLGLEEGMESALDSARHDGANIVELGPSLDPVPFPGGAQDPHVWLDLGRAADGARLIGAQLEQATGEAAYGECGERVAGQIAQTEQEVVARLAAIGEDERILISDHDSMRYFASAYGFTVAAVVIPGGSTLAEPSSAHLADVAATIRTTGVPAVFADRGEPTGFIGAAAAEAGEVAVVPLYVESVGEPGSGADTYQSMMLDNAASIAAALS